MRTESVSPRRCSSLARWFVLALLLSVSAPALAENAWVKDELRVNLRTGPGVQFRILGALATGDAVRILAREEGWTRVDPENLPEGWIPSGYLQASRPARSLLAELEAQNAELRRQLAETTASEGRLRRDHDEVAGRDASQQAEITRLTRENLELRVGARWPEWITGAGIVLVGMLLGAISARSSRRRRQRIKL